MASIKDDTIGAPATPCGKGGVAMVRVSGPEALAAAACLGGDHLKTMASHTLKLAVLRDGEGVIDQAVVGYYAAPNSYTGEDVAEFSVHGSPYIVDRLMRALTARGVRVAEPGEFTQRAFLNGKMDLSQAEAVADLIAGENKATHDMAIRQLRGGFSSEIAVLREKLLEFVGLVELELDFGEEDVEFADRDRLRELLREIADKVESLRRSFLLGNALKAGIPVAIVGKPNAGKSTLMNALLHEERAIVSDIPGTTRDSIEEVWVLDGVSFRFIDTAGLRESSDIVERMGVARTLRKMRNAGVWLYLFDAETMTEAQAERELAAWKAKTEEEGSLSSSTPTVILVGNKSDKLGSLPQNRENLLYISAKTGQGLDKLEDTLRKLIPVLPDGQTVILNNARHYEALGLVGDDLEKIRSGLDTALPGDLLAMDIRSAIDHLGLITGKILTDDILQTIFSRFCIGK